MDEFDLSQANNISVDTSSGKTKTRRTVGDLLGARSERDAILNQQKSAVLASGSDLSQSGKELEQLLTSLNSITDKTKKSIIESVAPIKDIQKTLDAVKDIQAQIVAMTESGNTKAKDLNALNEKTQEVLIDTRDIMNDIKDVYNEQTKEVTKQTELSEKSRRLRRETSRLEKKSLKDKKKETDKLIDDANKSIYKAFSDGADKLSTKFSQIKQMFDINKLANISDQSSASKIQTQLQRAYGINSSQFSQFKAANEKSINSKLYNKEDRMNAYSSLQQIGIGNADTATKYYNTLIQGQSLLGMSVDTQKQLYTLQRMTGNESLKFMTQKVAKYMTTATNLSKDQLNELVSVNANTAQQAVDYGVDSQEFLGATNDFTTAMANLTGDTSIASKYQNVVMQSLSDSQTAAQYYGKDVGSMQDFWNSGGNFLDLLESTNGTAGEWFRNYLSDFEGTKKDATYAVESGVLDRSTNSLIQQLAKLQLEGKDLRAEMKNFNSGTTGEEALKTVEQQQLDSLSLVQQKANELTGFLMTEIDWTWASKLDSWMTTIIALLGAISAMDAFGGLGNIFKGGKNAIGKIAGKANNSKLLSGLYSSKLGSGGLGLISDTGAAGLSTAGKFLAGGSIAAGALWAGVDAVKGFKDTSKEMYGENATVGQKLAAGTATLFSGSKVQKNSEGKVDVGKNAGKGALSGAGKGALIGAGLGSIIPGLGTVVGGAVGGVIGAVGGFFGGLFKGKKAKKQEELQEKQLEEEKKIAENTQTTSEKTSSLYQALATSNKEVSYVPRASGAVPNITFHGSDIHKSAVQQTALGQGAFSGSKGDKLGPWFVTSPYGSRKDPISGATKFHGGIDLSLGGTQEIYAPFGGTVKHITQGAKEGFGPYGLAVINGDKTFYFGHMKARYPKDGETISAGTHVGTMGNYGYSTGQHLHYQVNQNGHSIDPVPYTTDSLWDGTPGTGLSNSSDSSASSTNASELYKKYVVKLGTGGMGDPNGGVISGLDRINQTLIDLSNRQTQQEQIMNMLAGKKKPDPTF